MTTKNPALLSGTSSGYLYICLKKDGNFLVVFNKRHFPEALEHSF